MGTQSINEFTEYISDPEVRTPRKRKRPQPDAGDALRRRSIEVTVIAVDPSVKDASGHIVLTQIPVPADRVEPGPRSHRFHVVDYDTTTRVATGPAIVSDARARVTYPGWKWKDRFTTASNHTLETDPTFRAQNVWAIAMRTLDNFEQALGRRLPWAFTGHHLFLVPNAFAEPNAYYASEDRAVLFGYLPRSSGPPVYTSLSHDVIAHEVTHAILDGLRPRLVEPGLPDQPAFHEGFADIVAILSILSSQEVIEHTIAPADEDGRIGADDVAPEVLKASVLLGVANQLGAALNGDRGTALRRSVALPRDPQWRADPSFDEPHRRGEILVAAVTQALIGIWSNRLRPITIGGRVDRSRAAEEGAKAASHLLGMCIRAIDLTPPVEFEFDDYIDAVLVADEIVAPDDNYDYRGVLKRSFESFGITAPTRKIIDLNKRTAKPRYEKINHDALRVDEDEIYRFIWQNDGFLGINLAYHLHVERVRHASRVGPDGLIVNEILADYIQTLNIPIGALAGIGVTVAIPAATDPSDDVQMLGGGVLVFDQFARARFHQTKQLQDWERQTRRLAYLVSHGLVDTKNRFGFSLGERQGQRFSALHADTSRSGEAW